MSSVQLVSEKERELETAPVEVRRTISTSWTGWCYLVAGSVLLAVIGSWLVWFSASIQRQFQQEDIRAACQRVMPETTDRCVDTVVIQRGGVRR